MSLSLPELIGALIGLGLGWLDYRILSGVVEGKLRKLDRSEGEERAGFERKIRLMKGIFFVMTVGAFPVVGYLLGQTIAGQ
ncbi:hypothetical protein KIH24_04300 [Rhizobiales bacterium TNE-4]|nr:hypothetical protein [Rhizobiales bacterium TNE-4]MBV1826842.1 hypothetical protein [Rhizobiales bacterium TNE-4]